jgi:hypothetical protein
MAAVVNAMVENLELRRNANPIGHAIPSMRALSEYTKSVGRPFRALLA